MNRLVLSTILLIICGSLSSCSFHHKATGKKAQHVDKNAAQASADTSHLAAVVPPVAAKPDTTMPAKDTSAIVKQLINDLTPLWQKRLVYKTFTGKAKVHFEGPDKDVEFSANIRVKKDSAIWVMITALGGIYQVARIYITPDSFYMINYSNKEVTRIPLSHAAKILPTSVEFSSLQNLIMGDPLHDGIITDASSFGGSWSINVADSNYLQQITYNREDSTMRTGQLRTRKPDGPQAMIQYGDYEMHNDRKVSTERVVRLQNGADQYTLDMHFVNAEFDVPVEFPFSIPKNYSVKND